MRSPFIKLDEANCHSCMKCVRVCPTGAMTYNGMKPEVVDEDCILCGRCYTTCPRGAQKLVSEFSRLERWLKQKEEIVLSVDPAFASIWPDYKSLRVLLQARGIRHVEETARAAVQVSQAYAQLIRDGKMKNIITSSCPAVNVMIEREFPDLLDQLAPIATPAAVHGRLLRKKYPKAKLVYLTPCAAAYREFRDARFANLFDLTVGMDEMARWLHSDYSGIETTSWGNFEGSIARHYGSCSGIIHTLEPSDTYDFIAADGIGRVRTMLQSIQRGEITGCFLEVAACRGSCLAGPMLSGYPHSEWAGAKRIASHSSDVKITAPELGIPQMEAKWKKEVKKEVKHFTKNQIDAQLRRMGKDSPDKLYDCGACGYDTCRKKAEAVLAGRADPRVCLPEALEKAESMANMIIRNTPNGIIVFNDALEVTEMNDGARKMLGMRDKDPIGMSVFEVFPEGNIAEAVMNMQGRRQYSRNWYECYHKLFDEVVIHMNSRQAVVILMDRTVEDARIVEMNNMRDRTFKVTQDVIDQQMRTVQEIASLLGETTAKSKIALLNLQRVMDEGTK